MSVHTSNRLGDLSARIREACDRAASASIEAAEQSLEAGRLLIEAKEACKHGEWGPFLEMSGVHERQARRLMRLARSGLKADTVSEMGGIKAALESLAERKLPENPTSEDIWYFFEDRLHGPLSVYDIEVEGWRWLAAKLMRQLDFSVKVHFAIECHDEYNLKVLRLCDSADIIEAMHAIAPLAKSTASLKFAKSLTTKDLMQLAISVEFTARRIALWLCDEIEYRGKVTEATFWKGRKHIRKQLGVELDEGLIAASAEADRLMNFAALHDRLKSPAEAGAS